MYRVFAVLTCSVLYGYSNYRGAQNVGPHITVAAEVHTVAPNTCWRSAELAACPLLAPIVLRQFLHYLKIRSPTNNRAKGSCATYKKSEALQNMGLK